MRPRAAIALLALSLLTAACGAEFKLPTESRGGFIPGDESYQILATWRAYTDGSASTPLDGIQDILLTQGLGTQLFLLINRGGTGTAPRGEIVDVALSRPLDLTHRFNTLFNPFAMTVGGDGVASSSNRIFVLDQGDTCLAKISPRTGRCGDTTAVTRLEYYWRVREFGLLGGDTLSTFTDLNFAHVNGVAADAAGNVYVSGVAVVTLADTDPRLFRREFQFRIFRYRRGPRYPGVTPPDPRMPGAQWHRDTTWQVAEGLGVGFIRDARGMQWSTAAGSPGLFAADFGNLSGEKLDTNSPSTGYYRMELDGNGSQLRGPVDVSADAAGYSYVCDASASRVYRYGPDGAYVQTVDLEANDNGLPLLGPVAVAANDSLVYIADRARGEVLRYKRRK